MLPEKIRSWWDNIFSEFCPRCRNTCCDSSRHLIDLYGEDNIELFTTRGLEVFFWSSLDENSAIEWVHDRTKPILKKDGSLLPKPSIVQLPVNITKAKGNPAFMVSSRMMGVINAEKFCPFYETVRRGCSIHTDPRRPNCCRNYPLICPEYPHGKANTILIKNSCYLTEPKIFDEILARFEREFISTPFKLESEKSKTKD